MPDAPELPRGTPQESWRSNVAGALRGIRGDLDLLVMQETPPEAVEFGYFHHLGLPYEDHWARPFVASARTADAIRDNEREGNPEMGRSGSRFVLMQKTGILSSGNAGDMNLQVHASLVVNYRPLRPDAERNPGPPFLVGLDRITSLQGGEGKEWLLAPERCELPIWLATCVGLPDAGRGPVSG